LNLSLFFSGFGIDPYPPSSESRVKGSWLASAHVTPYYQDASEIWPTIEETELPLGQENGAWNLIGILYGLDLPTAGSFEPALLPNATWAGPGDASEGNYLHIKKTLVALNDAGQKVLFDPADPAFDPAQVTTGREMVTLSFKRLGLRGEVRFAPFEGGDVTLRGGVCEYRKGLASTIAPSDDLLEQKLQNDFTRTTLLDDLGLSMAPVNEVGLEDCYARASAGYPLVIYNAEGTAAATICPNISGGIWLPTAKKRNHDQLFSIATGNDGHTGYCLEGALNVDFHQTITLSIGGGATFFNDKTIDSFRVPNHRLQNGYIPWTTKVTRDPGYSWFAHVSIRSINFIDRVTFYGDYSYQAHKSDNFTCNDPDPQRAELFTEGIKMLKEQSTWHSWEMHGHVSYAATNNLELGLGIHTCLRGAHVYRTNSILGSVRFVL
jgi:hypothetical protein